MSKTKHDFEFTPDTYFDNRGSFRELLNLTKDPWFDGELFIQQNVSISKQGVFRGMHYQYRFPQGKLVTVLQGGVIDFIIDLRQSSPEYGKLKTFHLTAGNMKQVWVPQGYAHGFLALENDTVFMYNIFGNIRHADDEVSISPWSIPDLRTFLLHRSNTLEEIIMSDKDKQGMDLKDAPRYD